MRKLLSSILILGAFFSVIGAVNSKPVPPGRFVNHGDGTITDRKTGLMWEMKLESDDVEGNCADETQANRSIHCVNNRYLWSGTRSTTEGLVLTSKPDGPLFTDFLANLNRADGSSNDGQRIDRKNHSDWRIPNIVELQSILDCNQDNCLDQAFGATAPRVWSSTTLEGARNFAWWVEFFGNVAPFNVKTDSKGVPYGARAVRGGR